jgi:hypothetical protein
MMVAFLHLVLFYGEFKFLVFAATGEEIVDRCARDVFVASEPSEEWGVAIRCAVVRYSGLDLRGRKRKRSKPFRKIGRHINYQPAAGGYCYGLCDSHIIKYNILRMSESTKNNIYTA